MSRVDSSALNGGAESEANHIFHNLPETIEKLMFHSHHHHPSESTATTFPVDILHTPKDYVFYMDVPGLSKSDIQVPTLCPNLLDTTISEMVTMFTTESLISGDDWGREDSGDPKQREEEARGRWRRRWLQVSEAGEKVAAETDEEVPAAGKCRHVGSHGQVRERSPYRRCPEASTAS